MLKSAIIAVVLLVPSMYALEAQQKSASAEMRVPFKVGEQLTYDVSWSGYLTAGTVTLSVQDKHLSYASTAYYVVAQARPTPLMSKVYTLYYKADALIDVYNMLPQRASVYSEEGKRHLMKVTLFNQNARKATFENTTAKNSKREFAVPAYVQDALSAIYVLRALPMNVGSHTTMPVSTAGHNYKAQVYVDGQESIRTAAGTFPSWRLRAVPYNDQGKAQGNPLLLWISDTPDRVPVKLQGDLAIGSFNLTLSAVRSVGVTP